MLRDEFALLIGSQMCTAFSQFNNIKYMHMFQEEVTQRIEYGRTHLEFCARLYEIQWRAGRYFRHEHPTGASSWDGQCIKKMLNKFGGAKTTADQCMFGFITIDGQAVQVARKRASTMINAPCIADQLRRRCPNSRGWKPHEHMTLVNGSLTFAHIYIYIYIYIFARIA